MRASALQRDSSADTTPSNFLDAMVSGQGDGTAAFTDSEVVGNALTMLLAGEDTTSNTLAWMMHLMTQHPAVQARMQEEADRVLGSAKRPPDYASTERAPLHRGRRARNDAAQAGRSLSVG